LLDCLGQDTVRDRVRDTDTAIIEDTDKEFVRAMDNSVPERSLQQHHLADRGSSSDGQAWSPGRALQPPTHSQDWVQVASQQFGTYRNITPTSQVFKAMDMGDLLAGLVGEIVGSEKTTAGCTCRHIRLSAAVTPQPATS
jgi:hypothetical protein